MSRENAFCYAALCSATFGHRSVTGNMFLVVTLTFPPFGGLSHTYHYLNMGWVIIFYYFLAVYAFRHS